MTVRRPEEGEIIFEDDVVVVQAETLMKWTNSIISIADLRAAISRREGKKWKEIEQSESGDTPSGRKDTRR